MNHIRAILDVPAEWRIYKEKQAQYIADKLQGKTANKPRHPALWTFVAGGFLLLYGGGLVGIIVALALFHPLSTYLVGGVAGLFWILFSLIVSDHEDNYAEEQRKEERRRNR